jgi:predicted nucleic acid-binding protein
VPRATDASSTPRHDLLIAATAQVTEVPLISLDEDLRPLADVIDLRSAG